MELTKNQKATKEALAPIIAELVARAAQAAEDARAQAKKEHKQKADPLNAAFTDIAVIRDIEGKPPGISYDIQATLKIEGQATFIPDGYGSQSEVAAEAEADNYVWSWNNTSDLDEVKPYRRPIWFEVDLVTIPKNKTARRDWETVTVHKATLEIEIYKIS